MYIQICVYTELNFCQTDANIHFSKFVSWSTCEYACCMDVSKDASPDYKHKLVCIRYGFMATTKSKSATKVKRGTAGFTVYRIIIIIMQ